MWRCALTEGESKSGTDTGERKRTSACAQATKLTTDQVPVSGGQSSLIEQGDASPITPSVSK